MSNSITQILPVSSLYAVYEEKGKLVKYKIYCLHIENWTHGIKIVTPITVRNMLVSDRLSLNVDLICPVAIIDNSMVESEPIELTDEEIERLKQSRYYRPTLCQKLE